MPSKFADRVQETTTTTGTGALNLDGAVTGCRAFSSAFSSGDTVPYSIVGDSEWEVGIGTLTSGSPWTLTRTTVLASSNAGSAVNFSVGTKNVACVALARLMNILDNSFDKCQVYLNSTFNVTQNTTEKLPLDASSFDTNGLWNGTTKRITPKKAGYYFCVGRYRRNATNSIMICMIYKNGVAALSSIEGGSGRLAVHVDGFVYCNGTTDYLELWYRDDVGTSFTVTTGAFDTHLQVVGPF